MIFENSLEASKISVHEIAELIRSGQASNKKQ